MTMLVTREVTTEQLRNHDRIIACQNNSRVAGLTVDWKAFGRSRFTVKFSDGKERAFQADDVFTVEREEATPEEVAASKRHDQMLILRAGIADLRQHSTREMLENALADEQGCYLGWSQLGDLIEDQELARHGEYLAYTYERYAEVVADELTALLGAFGSLLDIRDNRRRRNPMSRSTHQISNLIEEMQDYVLDQIIEKATRWNEIDEAAMIEARRVCIEAQSVSRVA